MFIQPYYHISIIKKSFAEMPGTSGVIFGGSAVFELMTEIARIYSTQNDCLILIGCVDEETPKKAYFHGTALHPVDADGKITYYCIARGLLEKLHEGDEGFYLAPCI